MICIPTPLASAQTQRPSRSKSLVRKSSRVPVVSVGTCHVQTETTGTHLGSLLDDLKVNGRERGRLDLGHLARCTVMVGLPVGQRAIQHNPDSLARLSNIQGRQGCTIQDDIVGTCLQYLGWCVLGVSWACAECSDNCSTVVGISR